MITIVFNPTLRATDDGEPLVTVVPLTWIVAPPWFAVGVTLMLVTELETLAV
jgi:hypothetical protein